MSASAGRGKKSTTIVQRQGQGIVSGSRRVYEESLPPPPAALGLQVRRRLATRCCCDGVGDAGFEFLQLTRYHCDTAAAANSPATSCLRLPAAVRAENSSCLVHVRFSSGAALRTKRVLRFQVLVA